MLIPESEWAVIRRRSRLPAFEAAVRRLRGEATTFLEQPLPVPSEPAGYYHDYFCPEHGVQLLFDPALPTEHHCPVDGIVHRGVRYDAAWRWFVNERLSQAALHLALLWQLQGNPAGLAGAAGILKAYSLQYDHYRDLARDGPNPGIATYTTLDEAVWLLPLVWGFDLVANDLPGGEAQAIADRLFLPAAEHLVQHHYGGIHNFACWHNAAIGTIGLVLNRRDLVRIAVDGSFGFDAQLREGVLADGLWYEGSFSYHFYALAGFLALAKAAYHDPTCSLHTRPALRSMLRAPVLCAHPDGSLPATNDCWYFTSLIGDCCHGVPPAAAFYELGYAWFDDPLFAQVLHRAYRHGVRDSLEALLYGRETLPDMEMDPLSSVHLPSSGYAILRSPLPAPPAGQTHILLKYGPHGGRHGHPDKLNLALYAHGCRLSPDLGTPGYGFDLLETWYRQTISHNTVTIDGRSQPPATGRIRAFRSEGSFQVADAVTTWEDGDYKGITVRRAILARPDYFLDLCLVRADRQRRIDWHFRGAAADLRLFGGTNPELTACGPMDAEGDGYQHIAQAQRARVGTDLLLAWQVGEVGLWLFMAGTEGAEVILGSVPGNPPLERHSLLINRRYAATTAYLSVFHPYEGSARVRSVRWLGRDPLGTGWASCVVRLSDIRELWWIQLVPGAKRAPERLQNAVSAQFDYCLEW